MVAGDSSIKVEDSEEDRRASFVDRLLSEEGSSTNASSDTRTPSDLSKDIQEIKTSRHSAHPIAESMSFQYSLVHCYLNDVTFCCDILMI